MLPNTRNTIQRIRKLTSAKDSESLIVSESVPSIVTTNSPNNNNSYEGTFTSNDFQSMYTSTTIDSNSNSDSINSINDRHIDYYKYSYPFEDELDASGLPDTFEPGSKLCTVNVCMYRICKGSHTFPYLQFKLKLDSKKNKLAFPTFTHRFTSSDSNSSDFMMSSCMKRANDIVMVGADTDTIEFKGVYHYKPHASSHTIHPQSGYWDSGIADKDMDGGKRPRAKNNKNKNKNKDKDKEDNDNHSSDDGSDGSDSSSSSYSDSGSFDDESPDGSLYLIYQDTSYPDEDARPIKLAFNCEWWWTCVHEIFNTKCIMYRTRTIGYNVTALFKSEPSALFLMNEKGVIYETPHVLYKGLPEHISLDEMAAFGPRKNVDDNNVSTARKKNHAETNINELFIHGSYYYLYDFCNAMRGACYTYDDETNQYVKNKRDKYYMFRYIVFLGKMKTVMFDTNGSTNHTSINIAHMMREIKWPGAGYNSVYHGKYKLSKPKQQQKWARHKDMAPVFSIADPHRFNALSYHELDPATVPADIELLFKKNAVVRIK